MDVSSVKKPAVLSQQARPALQREDHAPKVPEAHKPPAAKPLPVVNTQGHTTGRLINTTA